MYVVVCVVACVAVVAIDLYGASLGSTDRALNGYHIEKTLLHYPARVSAFAYALLAAMLAAGNESACFMQPATMAVILQLWPLIMFYRSTLIVPEHLANVREHRASYEYPPRDAPRRRDTDVRMARRPRMESLPPDISIEFGRSASVDDPAVLVTEDDDASDTPEELVPNVSLGDIGEVTSVGNTAMNLRSMAHLAGASVLLIIFMVTARGSVWAERELGMGECSLNQAERIMVISVLAAGLVLSGAACIRAWEASRSTSSWSTVVSLRAASGVVFLVLLLCTVVWIDTSTVRKHGGDFLRAVFIVVPVVSVAVLVLPVVISRFSSGDARPASRRPAQHASPWVGGQPGEAPNISGQEDRPRGAAAGFFSRQQRSESSAQRWERATEMQSLGGGSGPQLKFSAYVPDLDPDDEDDRMAVALAASPIAPIEPKWEFFRENRPARLALREFSVVNMCEEVVVFATIADAVFSAEPPKTSADLRWVYSEFIEDCVIKLEKDDYDDTRVAVDLYISDMEEGTPVNWHDERPLFRAIAAATATIESTIIPSFMASRYAKEYAEKAGLLVAL